MSFPHAADPMPSVGTPFNTSLLPVTAFEPQLRAWAERLVSHIAGLERRFRSRLKVGALEKRALAAITSAAAARVLDGGGKLPVFLEQVEYHGRRLARLNMTPQAVTRALRLYDSMAARAIGT